MKAFRLALLELRRFRGGPLRRLVPVALALVPLLYGSLYLWANWDPYGSLDEVPVAVVNQDQPVQQSGQYINAGDQFVRQLKTTELFDWHFTDAADARKGLRQGRYYFTITVPRGFSAGLATATRPNPRHAEMTITKNDANGYIAGIMADTVEARLQNQVNSAAHTAYARAIYGEVDAVREKLRSASDAAGRLVEGSGLAEQSAGGLTEGLKGVHDGAEDISGGVEQISETAEQLDGRIDAVAELAADRIPGAVTSLVDASGVVVNGLSTVTTATGSITERTSENVSGLEQLGRDHPVLLDDPGYQRLMDNARRLSDAAANADTEADQALGDARQANDRALALRENTSSLQSRVRTLTAPADDLSSGTEQLASGTRTLVGGLQGLVGSSETLHTATNRLSGGARELSGLIDDSLAKIPPTSPTQVARAAEVLGSPALIEENNLNPAKVYGRGMAPFFFAIALWVFGMAAYLLLEPVNLRALGGRVSAFVVALAGLLPAAVLGIVGGLTLLGVLVLGLGLDPIHPLWTVGLVALAAAAFTTVVHFLRTWLGVVGDAVSLVLLIVQLTASGGLYPMETTPVFFQAIHPYLPMTYLVDGLRVTISGGLVEHLRLDLAVLGGFLVAFLALTTLVVRRHRTWTLRRLHPQIEL
ncbi:putative membrane protein [Saccharopolyspora lacisalsi]|uniref:Putative membrane protein n=1 Tax=Halosaccharopolyspora lacisalsi TaxID=1000566 RepID=A0A839DZY8_9PSEU|nr:YhgE/Pip domain-containing protein [Halosaccharopolyspora lacisalsi]MBA8826593.1 putative membrane protein [Halosaccharopolyspora lacisalsi]